MYTREEVKEMIYNYKWMNNFRTSQIYDVDSTSVAQYGIESVIPKAKGQAGDKVFLKVMNRNKAWRRNLKLIEKIEFIDKYEEYITNEMNFHILQMIKLGTKLKTVMDLMEIKSKSTFYGCLNEIVNVYMDAQKGYYD